MRHYFWLIVVIATAVAHSLLFISLTKKNHNPTLINFIPFF